MQILLTGMMGSGKSAVAPYLGHLLDCAVVDLDLEIERNLGMKVADFFEHEGEAAFREKEHAMLAVALQTSPAVVSLGGGTLCFERNWKLLPPSARVVWLNPSVDHLAERLAQDRSRPLLHGKNIRNELDRLFENRKDWYSRSHHQIDSGTGTPQSVAQRIAQWIHEEKGSK